MSDAPARRTPAWRAVLVEQLRLVGSRLRVPALVLLGAVVLVTLLEDGIAPYAFRPEHQMLPGALGLLLPLVLWRAEGRIRDGFLWAMPVERRSHALTRALAGWIWLMVALVAFVAWLLLVALVTGGPVLAGETVPLVPLDLPVAGALEPGMVGVHTRPAQPLLWLTPFAAGTATYLLATALSLAVRRPLVWAAGALVALMLVALSTELATAEAVRMAPSRTVRALLEGEYGLDTLLTARSGTLRMRAVLPDGSYTTVWRGLPDPRAWAIAALLWTSAGGLALWGASLRHRERIRRRPAAAPHSPASISPSHDRQS